MGDSSTPVNESMADMLRGMQENLPGVLQVISAAQPDIARVQAQTDAAVSPIYADTQTRLYDTAGRDLNRIGNEIETENQRSASAREADIAGTYGPTLVAAADRLSKMLDPEFYNLREATGAKTAELVNAQDPTGLSPGERAEIERSLARSGAVNPASSSQTVANAMTFGQALQQKQQGVANILATAGATAPALRSGMDAFNIATRRSAVPNTGDAKFVGGQTGTGQNAWQTGNQFLGAAGQLAATNAQKKTSLLDDIMKGATGFGSIFNFS